MSLRCTCRASLGVQTDSLKKGDKWLNSSVLWRLLLGHSAWYKDAALMAGQCRHLPSVEQQTHIKRSYNKYIMGQQSVQAARQAGRTWLWAEVFFCFVFFYNACFIIHKEDEVSRMQGLLLAEVPKLLHSFTPSKPHTHTHTLLKVCFCWDVCLDSRSSFLHGQWLLQQLHCWNEATARGLKGLLQKSSRVCQSWK